MANRSHGKYFCIWNNTKQNKLSCDVEHDIIQNLYDIIFNNIYNNFQFLNVNNKYYLKRIIDIFNKSNIV
jgi:hypothetical protein